VPNAYKFTQTYASLLRWPLLTAIRLFWGWQFAATGWGKLNNIAGVTSFFTDLGIPLPELNAWLAAGTEFIGGIALFLGLGARIASIPLIFTMCVAFATADREALLQITSNPDAFVSSAPFPFLLASLLVLAFGPGPLSIDRLWEPKQE